ncbi:16S rRNA (cytidine(1402)-2'-O)-methyltransferase [Spiroplasma endosymbiont of Amphibalanus improvisus]|uniref:16S rRNA (cytidine(1402)-2'-O)-methyltransferase n=1 Tax=Spiroplasma endosymbiont of Amphibalanus improvisus TaxID=3066327 RepID=UPI00313F08F0
MNENGDLFLVATPIGNLSEFSERAIKVLNNVDVIFCEDQRVTIKLLNFFSIKKNLKTLNAKNEKENIDKIIDLLSKNLKIALLSDAGYPLISDPGNLLLKSIIERNFKVVPISGPSAFLNALVCSGFNTQHFIFHGFLSSKDNKAKEEIIKYKNFNYPIIFYESPHRILRTLNIFNELLPDTKICVAKELTKKFEKFYYGNANSIGEELKDNHKGEFVLIIENYVIQEKIKINKKNVYNEIEFLIKNDGLKIKVAINIIADKYQLSKNELYKEFHKNRK